MPNCDPIPGTLDFDQTEEVSLFHLAHSFDKEFCQQRITENLTGGVQHTKRGDVHTVRNCTS